MLGFHSYRYFLNFESSSKRKVVYIVSCLQTERMQSSKEGKEMFYLTTHSTHLIYVYMASERW